MTESNAVVRSVTLDAASKIAFDVKAIANGSLAEHCFAKGEVEMVPGLYSAATAMNVADQRHQVVAQNLAHLNMPGYRRSVAHQQNFESSMDKASQGKFQFDLLGTSLVSSEVDFTPGRYEQTGRKLDVALHGDGFFTIDADGQELYTRNGAFQTDQDGRLITSDGYPLVGENGQLVIPPGASPAQLSISKDGTAAIGEQVIGKLRIVNFTNPKQLEQRGVTLFAAPDGVDPEASDAVVEQGAREHSNVTPVLEMVELIAINRSHDAAQKAMNALNEVIKKRIET